VEAFQTVISAIERLSQAVERSLANVLNIETFRHALVSIKLFVGRVFEA
jgi:hypothetical protein